MRAQQLFRTYFRIPQNQPIPSANAIRTWINDIEAIADTTKITAGKPKNVRKNTR